MATKTKSLGRNCPGVVVYTEEKRNLEVQQEQSPETLTMQPVLNKTVERHFGNDRNYDYRKDRRGPPEGTNLTEDDDNTVIK